MARQPPREARDKPLPAGHDPRQPIDQLLKDLKTSLDGLSSAEAKQRLVAYGPNELPQAGGARWWRDLIQQLIHPLALVLWVAAGLAWIAGTPVLAAAIVVVILINAVFAFAQRRHAEPRKQRANEVYRPHPMRPLTWPAPP